MLTIPALLHAFVVLVSVQLIVPGVAVASGPDGDGGGGISSCRSYCGNITVDYPFGLRPGCGHSGFRELLYCINDVLMLYIPSGSYRALDIDYTYRGLTLHEPAMSDCYSMMRSPEGRGNGFVVEPWRAPFLEPDPDNVFMLLGCRPESPLFHGFPGKHLPYRNVSGMGCEDYYHCPVWWGRGDEDLRGGATSTAGRGPSWNRDYSAAYGAVSPPECCAVDFGSIRSINVSNLRCEGYSSAYSLAPLRLPGPGAWTYGIRVSYTLPADHQKFCGACEATGGVCGYEQGTGADLCLCGSYNTTSNCDSVVSSIGARLRRAAPIGDHVEVHIVDVNAVGLNGVKLNHQQFSLVFREMRIGKTRVSRSNYSVS